MPYASPRPCAFLGCSGLVRDRGKRYCPEHREHERERRRHLDRGRRKTAERGYGSRWRRESKMFLRGHPWCEDPYDMHPGVTKLATLVDHIIPHRDNRSLFWDRSNWQGLCDECHRWKTAQDVRAYQGGLPPISLPAPAIPVTLVCGPPGAGKSRLVATRRAAADVVVDLDQIKAELSGLSLYHAGDKWVRPALAERDRRLAELARASKGRAWVIVSAPRAEQRESWSEALHADLVLVLRPPPHVCRERILADDRRPREAKRVSCHALQRWHREYRVRPGDRVLRRVGEGGSKTLLPVDK